MTRRMRLAIGALTGVAVACLALPIAALLLVPPAPRTHAESIASVLAKRGVSYERISFVQNYEESNELDFYRAQVLVSTPDGKLVSGWIGCEDRDSICFLELRGLGVTGERLPELASEPLFPWLGWARDALRRAGLTL